MTSEKEEEEHKSLIHRIILEYVSIQQRLENQQPIIYDFQELHKRVQNHPLFKSFTLKSFDEINAIFKFDEWQEGFQSIMPGFRFYVGLSSYTTFLAWSDMRVPDMVVYSNTNLFCHFHGGNEMTIFMWNQPNVPICTCHSLFDLYFSFNQTLKFGTHPHVLGDFLFLLPPQETEDLFLGPNDGENDYIINKSQKGLQHKTRLSHYMKNDKIVL